MKKDAGQLVFPSSDLEFPKDLVPSNVRWLSQLGSNTLYSVITTKVCNSGWAPFRRPFRRSDSDLVISGVSEGICRVPSGRAFGPCFAGGESCGTALSGRGALERVGPRLAG